VVELVERRIDVAEHDLLSAKRGRDQDRACERFRARLLSRVADKSALFSRFEEVSLGLELEDRRR
jgi:hypothetical protein